MTLMLLSRLTRGKAIRKAGRSLASEPSVRFTGFAQRIGKRCSVGLRQTMTTAGRKGYPLRPAIRAGRMIGDKALLLDLSPRHHHDSADRLTAVEGEIEAAGDAVIGDRR